MFIPMNWESNIKSSTIEEMRVITTQTNFYAKWVITMVREIKLTRILLKFNQIITSNRLWNNKTKE